MYLCLSHLSTQLNEGCDSGDDGDEEETGVPETTSHMTSTSKKKKKKKHKKKDKTKSTQVCVLT